MTNQICIKGGRSLITDIADTIATCFSTVLNLLKNIDNLRRIIGQQYLKRISKLQPPAAVRKGVGMVDKSFQVSDHTTTGGAMIPFPTMHVETTTTKITP